MDEASARRDAWELANKVRQLDKEIAVNHELRVSQLTQMSESVEAELAGLEANIATLLDFT